MRQNVLFSVLVGVPITALLIASFAAAKGPPNGGEDTFGNNLSVPAIFVPDSTGGPELRVDCGASPQAPGEDGKQPSTEFEGYWLQKTEATWSASCTTAATANVIADWGDNLTSRPTQPAGQPIRVEMSLLALAATGMKGYAITNLTPDLADRLATYGTRGAPEDEYFTEAGTPTTRVFDAGATLTIEKIVDGAPTLVVFDGPMAAEINSTGAVVYGFNWGTKGKANAPAPGTYRLTFTTNNTVIIGIADTDTDNILIWDADSTSLEVSVTSGKPGGGKKP